MLDVERASARARPAETIAQGALANVQSAMAAGDSALSRALPTRRDGYSPIDAAWPNVVRALEFAIELTGTLRFHSLGAL